MPSHGHWGANKAADTLGPAATDAPPLVRPTQLEPPPSSVPFAFRKLCRVMDNIRSTQGNEAKRDKLDKLFKGYREHVGLDLYPLIRLLLPDRDRERSVFNLKEQKLAKAYNAVLGINSKDNHDAKRLENWKVPVAGGYGPAVHNDRAVGDFPMVLYDILRVKGLGTDVYSLDDVNAKLNELVACKGDQKAVVRVLKDFEKNLSPESQSWLARIILKDMKLTLKEKSVLDTFHPDAMRLFIVCSDLRRVCWTLWSPERLDKEDQATQINIFSPFQSMYAARNGGDLAQAVKAIGGPFMIEEKLDGERIQLHKKGDKFQYWSRQGKDYTSLYGRDKTVGSLTPYIAGAFRADIEDCILDGELLAYDPGLQRYLSFGTLKTTALAEKTDNPDDPNVIYMVFDIVYLRLKNTPRGTSLASNGKFHLTERKKLLEGVTAADGTVVPGIVRKVRNRLEFPYRRDNCTKPEQIKEELDQILRRRGEGLILKKNTAPYTPSGRSDLWIKIKPEYFDELGENADLLVLGGWYGKGHRGGKLGGFLLGVRMPDDQTDDDGGPVYSTVCKVGSGLNLREFEWIRDNHQKNFQPLNRKDPASWPSCIKFAAKGIEDKPDVWIHPSKAFVLEVKGAEIIDSDDFAVGQTLRFARSKYLRYDLASQQKMAARGSTNVALEEPSHFTIEDWHELQNRQHQIPAGGNMSRKRRRLAPSRTKQGVLSSFAGIDSKAVKVTDQIFAGTTARILTGCEAADQQRLQELFVQHGGKVKVSYTAPTDGSVLVVISSKTMAQTNIITKKDRLDIVKPEWILDSVKAKQELPLHRKYLVFATSRTREAEAYDAEPAEPAEPAEHAPDAGSESETDDEADDERPRRAPAKSSEAVLVKAYADDDDPSDASSHTEADTDSEDERAMSSAPYASVAGASGDKYLEHMVFYLDTLDLWERNGLSALEIEQDESDELAQFAPKIVAHGGKVTADLHEPALTHIVMCGPKDHDRFGELLDKTRDGRKIRQVVAVSWLEQTFDEASPQPESAHRPA